jgi:hypothetical protein
MELINVCGHTFVKELLGTSPLVIDDGANHGIFSVCLTKEYLAAVYG